MKPSALSIPRPCGLQRARFSGFRSWRASQPELLDRLRAAQVRIIAADRHSSSPLHEADLRGSLAIMVGREASGLPPEIAREAPLLLRLPFAGDGFG